MSEGEVVVGLQADLIDVPPLGESECMALIDMIPGFDIRKHAGDCVFDWRRASNAIWWIENHCCHVKGHLAGQNFILYPELKAFVGNLFGWVHPNGLRRFRKAFLYVPRKNSKTTACATIILYIMCCDAEMGFEGTAAAGDKDQALIVWTIMDAMIQANPILAEQFKTFRSGKSITIPEEGASFKAISREAGTKHGTNLHVNYLDELHAHKNRDLYDVLTSSHGSRRQPLDLITSTADFDRPSLCNEELIYAKKVRDDEHLMPDPAYFPALWMAEKNDDWKSEDVWKKANPGWGYSVQPDYIRGKFIEAINEPKHEMTFRRLYLNQTTETSIRWMTAAIWDRGNKGPIDRESLRGKRCWGGIDLSFRYDLTARVLYFPDAGGVLLPHFWMPEVGIKERSKRDRVPYEIWAQQGFLTLTPGDYVDYEFMRAKVNEDAEEFDLIQMGYDPWNAKSVCMAMFNEDGLPMAEFRQGMISMNEPTKKLMDEAKAGRLSHAGHPVLRWNILNAQAVTDKNLNIMLSKQKSTQRIDGAVASVMAVGCHLVAPENIKQSAYDKPRQMWV